MCGILGSINAYERINSIKFLDILNKFKHRGPDQYGTKLFCNNLIIGHNRLSIQDLSENGKQPMASKSKRYHIVFNGEIYNANSLAQRYLKHYTRQSSTDTEIILALLETYNDVKLVLRMLEGMFAFAIYDEFTNRLHLARDPFGEKPLFYSHDAKNLQFHFSSSIHAVSELTKQRNYDQKAIIDYLSYGYIRDNKTVYTGIKELQPGHLLDINLSNYESKIQRFFELKYDEPIASGVLRSDLKEHLHQTLRTVIKETLVADVEVGTFLSGGIDSSLVTALVARENPNVKTFSVGFEEKAFDESEYARQVANTLGVPHVAITANARNCLEILKNIPYAFEQPFADSSQVPTMLVSSIAKEHVSVCLTGDGADELFFGYDRYRQMAELEKLRRMVPSLFIPLVNKLIRSQFFTSMYSNRQIFERTLTKSLMYKIANTLEENDAEKRYYLSLSRTMEYRPEKLSKLQNPDLRLLDLLGYLPSDILVKVDRAAMFYSLETRAPFLNPKIAEIAFSKQHNNMINSKYKKDILKDILSDYIPRKLFERKKAGFSMPIGQWIRGPWREYVTDVMNTKSEIDNYVSEIKQREVLENILKGNDNDIYHLWDLFIFKQWELVYK